MPQHLSVARVLVMDDDKDLLALIHKMLERNAASDMEVAQVESLDTLIGNYQPDIVLLDICLGEQDGRALCRMVKERFGHKIPVILMSGNPMDAESVADAGANNFLEKPFSGEALIEILEEELVQVMETNS